MRRGDFRCDENWLPPIFQSFRDDFLAVTCAVHLCSIDQSHAKIEAKLESLDCFRVMRGICAHPAAHAPGAHSYLWNRFRCFSEKTKLQICRAWGDYDQNSCLKV